MFYFFYQHLISGKDLTMNDFLSMIAGKAGLDESTAEKGVGALLSSLKDNVPADTFSGVKDLIPDAGNVMNKFQNLPQTEDNSGGLSGLMGMASGLLGGKSEQIGNMVSLFSKAGFSLDMVKQFLPAVFDYIKTNGSESLVQNITKAIPELSSFLGDSDDGSILGKISKFF